MPDLHNYAAPAIVKVAQHLSAETGEGPGVRVMAWLLLTRG
jgi:hypothetical protein